MGYFQKLIQQGKERIEKESSRIKETIKKVNFQTKKENLKNYILKIKKQGKFKIKSEKLPIGKVTGALVGVGFVGVLLVMPTLSSEGVPILDPTYEAYRLNMDGEKIGIVESKEVIHQMMKGIEKNLQEKYQENIVVDDKGISFEKGEFREKETPLTDLEVIERKIIARIDFNLEAFAIMIEEQELVHLRSEKEAEELLEKITAEYVKDDMEYEAIEFNEEVSIQETLVPLGKIVEAESALAILQKGTDEEKTHRVVEGDTISEIAKQYGLTVEDIEKANSHLEDLHMISIGDELNLIVPKPYITVRTVEYIEYTEEIDFDTEYNDTDSLYKGDRKITQQGAVGKREITGYVIRENGRQVDLEVKEEKILSEPVTRIVAQGTAERPTTVATGSFSSPTRGRLTSGFGTRWGRMHNGIDVAGPTGTPVHSADAGRIEFAGYRGSYGNLIIINHENGYQTYYAHLNSINVSRGDRVIKGARIGSMGSTGRSTGPHLHFEVRRNGQPINPLNFVNY